jgi:hypothetical protein
VSEFDRLNEECASHIASLRLALTYVIKFSKDGGKGLFSPGGDGEESRAADALHSLALALVDSFRYLANAAVTLYSLPMKSPLRERLIILQAPLQRHAATSLGRLDSSSSNHLNINSLKQEPQRLALLATVSAMRTEMARCDAEVQPLLASLLQSASTTATESLANESARIPCEICGLVVKLSNFQDHVQRHGVALENEASHVSSDPGFGGDRSANPLDGVFRVVTSKHASNCVPPPPFVKADDSKVCETKDESPSTNFFYVGPNVPVTRKKIIRKKKK